jgi:hypothetical protein
MADKIYVGIDNKKIELKSEALEAYLLEEAKILQAEQERISLFEAEQQAKEATKESALAKLAALGLTEDEAKAIMGVN